MSTASLTDSILKPVNPISPETLSIRGLSFSICIKSVFISKSSMSDNVFSLPNLTEPLTSFICIKILLMALTSDLTVSYF